MMRVVITNEPWTTYEDRNDGILDNTALRKKSDLQHIQRRRLAQAISEESCVS